MKILFALSLLLVSNLGLANSLNCSDSKGDFTYGFQSYSYGVPPTRGVPRLVTELEVVIKGVTIVSQTTYDNGNASGMTNMTHFEFDRSTRKLIEGDEKVPVTSLLPPGTKRTYTVRVSYSTFASAPEAGAYTLICDEVSERPSP